MILERTKVYKKLVGMKKEGEGERLTHNSLKAFERRIREEKMLLKSRPKKEEETV